MSASDTSTCQSPTQGPCYFSIQPKRFSYSDETPLFTPYTPSSENIKSDPSNPLLAYRPYSPSSPRTLPAKMHASTASLLQLQTQAAHVLPSRRPKPQPLQKVLAVSDGSANSSDSSNRMDSSSLHSPPMDAARCSRCRDSQDIDMTTGKASDMVAYGLNSFYCTRCANLVGFQHR